MSSQLSFWLPGDRWCGAQQFLRRPQLTLCRDTNFDPAACHSRMPSELRLAMHSRRCACTRTLLRRASNPHSRSTYPLYSTDTLLVAHERRCTSMSPGMQNTCSPSNAAVRPPFHHTFPCRLTSPVLLRTHKHVEVVVNCDPVAMLRCMRSAAMMAAMCLGSRCGTMHMLVFSHTQVPASLSRLSSSKARHLASATRCDHICTAVNQHSEPVHPALRDQIRIQFESTLPAAPPTCIICLRLAASPSSHSGYLWTPWCVSSCTIA